MTRQNALSASDLELVAERLSLIRGHISRMPPQVISGVRVINGFLLVALRVEGHEMGIWQIDGQNVETFAQLTEEKK